LIFCALCPLPQFEFWLYADPKRDICHTALRHLEYPLYGLVEIQILDSIAASSERNLGHELKQLGDQSQSESA
jgi:hypothetical protein